MSTPVTVPELLEALRARGVVASDARPAPTDAVERPWFIALLLGVAGWLAGMFLLAFAGIMFRPDTTITILALGIVLLVGAWVLYFADRNAVFLDQLALAISIAGQFAVAWAIVKDTNSGFNIAATLLLLQLFVLAVMPNRTARTLAALFATIAWVYTVRFWLRPGQGDQIFFEEGHGQFPMFGVWSVPIGWLLTWVPLIALSVWLMLRESDWMASGLRHFARPVLTGLLLGLSFAGIAAEPFTVFVLGVESIGMGLAWWALFPLLSVVLALFAAWCAFRLRNSGLSGVAVVAALLHLARFYYLYGTTLLWKSVIMLILGAVLLLLGMALQRWQAGRTP